MYLKSSNSIAMPESAAPVIDAEVAVECGNSLGEGWCCPHEA